MRPPDASTYGIAGVPRLLRTVPDKVIGPGHKWDPARTARRMCIDPIAWDQGGPRVLGPSYTPTRIPRGAP
ncbi:hypothetical protein [Archangium violaceum]|uniref:hypothetical protein n=1 Tax=Archangium violaceum TaxID=83451 RepID=UPI0009FE84E4|nr:hypothetical protein [Archangium violaceum]